MTLSPSRTARVTVRRPRRRPDRAAFVRSVRRASVNTWRAWRRAPLWLRIAAGAVVVVAVWSVANLAYHVVRKPTELFLPVSGKLVKPPVETWRSYAPMFRDYSTATVSPELLAALAQVESAGDPVARTYWRWRFSWNPLRVFEPASSAVGLYQMTDPAFAEAKHYCIRHHQVIEDGPWYDARSCWLNGLYMRIFPSHAIELTAIYLDRKVRGLTERRHLAAATPQQKQDLAALIHLCGAGPAEAFARRGFRVAPGERCGDHDAAAYLAQVNAAKRQFLKLASAE